MERFEAVVVGAGQAGLAASHELTRAGVDHVVLERDRIGQAWRDRWDSFCLVTPNWMIALPGDGYQGDQPDGYLLRDEVVEHLEGYAAGFAAPVREGVEVVSVASAPTGGFVLRAADGEVRADKLILATGAYQRPHRPAAADGLPESLFQIDITGYRNPDSLPAGDVLIVGSGQSGCQLAEELHQAGRRVVLACGRAPWAPRRLGGHDMLWWARETGHLDATLATLPTPAARLTANVLGTGHGGGHDLHLRTLRVMGVTLVGHLVGADGRRARFAPDLADSVAWGDERFGQTMAAIRTVVEERGMEPFEIPRPEPFDPEAPEEIDLTGFGAVVFAGGFRPDHAWLPWREAFDDLGFPIQTDGASDVVDGLSFVGVHFLRKRKSSLLFGVGEDAAIVADRIAGRSGDDAGIAPLG